jgi:hypothetical protein
MTDTKTESPVAGLKERLGKVFDEIFALGRRAGRDEGYREGLAEGARVERERLAAVLSQASPGPGAPAKAPTGGAAPGGTEAAQKVLAAEAAKATGAITKITKVLAAETAKAAGRLFEGKDDRGRRPLAATEVREDLAAEAPGVSLEARCRADWEREPGLRSEFATLEAYTAFTRQREAGNTGL